MADKKVLEIPVDMTQLDELIAKVQQHHEQLKQLGPAWAQHNQGAAEAGEHTENLANNFEQAHRHTSKLGTVFDKFARATSDSKLSGNDSFVSRFERSSKNIETSWDRIERYIAKSQKELRGVDRMNLRFSAFGKTLLGLGGTAIGAAGAVMKTESDVSAQNLSAKELGLPLGQEKAFNAYFNPYGLGRSDLETAANNAGDITKYTPYSNAGISMQQFQNDDPEKLAFESAKAMGEKFGELEKQNPTTAVTTAKALGLTDVFTIAQLRALAKENAAGQLDTAQSQFNANWKQMGVDQKTADQASAFTAHNQANWDKIAKAFDQAELKLAPALDKWSDAATALTIKILGQAGSTGLAFENAAENPVPPGVKPTDKNPIVRGAEEAGQWMRQHIPGLSNAFNGGGGTGVSSMDTLLDATKSVESSNGKNLVGPMTKYGWQAMGAYQFSPDDLKRYHVKDPMDEADERRAAGDKYSDLFKEYNGNQREAEVAYNWGEGNLNQFLKNHHNQFNEKDLPPDVQDYLAKIDTAIGKGKSGSAYKSQVAMDQVGGMGNGKPYVFAQGELEWISKQIQIATGKSDKIISFFSEGGGSSFRNAQVQKVEVKSTVNLKVSAPAGSNVAVTGASLAQ